MQYFFHFCAQACAHTQLQCFTCQTFTFHASLSMSSFSFAGQRKSVTCVHRRVTCVHRRVTCLHRNISISIEFYQENESILILMLLVEVDFLGQSVIHNSSVACMHARAYLCIVLHACKWAYHVKIPLHVQSSSHR